MSVSTVDSERLLAEVPQSILERTLIAEYLLCKGYLMSDIKKLPLPVGKMLISDALRFTALRLDWIMFGDDFRSKIRLPITLN
jgi:hypothetical protein